jgi:hypothetical protein
MKVTNALVTYTNLTTMNLTAKGSPSTGDRIATKSFINTNYYVDEAANPYSTYTSLRCPPYQTILPPVVNLNVYLCVTNGQVFVYPVSAGNGSASGTLYNNSGNTVYIYGVFNSGGNSSGSVSGDSGTVNGLGLSFSGNITSSGQTIFSNTYVALANGAFVNWALSKQDTLSSGATLRLGYALTIGGSVTNLSENCVVPTTTTTTTQASFNFNVSSVCNGSYDSNTSITMNGFTGGSGTYTMVGASVYASEAEALNANAFFNLNGAPSFNYSSRRNPGTWWVVLVDSANTKKAKSVVTTCQTTVYYLYDRRITCATGIENPAQGYLQMANGYQSLILNEWYRDSAGSCTYAYRLASTVPSNPGSFGGIPVEYTSPYITSTEACGCPTTEQYVIQRCYDGFTKYTIPYQRGTAHAGDRVYDNYFDYLYLVTSTTGYSGDSTIDLTNQTYCPVCATYSVNVINAGSPECHPSVEIINCSGVYDQIYFTTTGVQNFCCKEIIHIDYACGDLEIDGPLYEGCCSPTVQNCIQPHVLNHTPLSPWIDGFKIYFTSDQYTCADVDIYFTAYWTDSGGSQSESRYVTISNGENTSDSYTVYNGDFTDLNITNVSVRAGQTDCCWIYNCY